MHSVYLRLSLLIGMFAFQGLDTVCAQEFQPGYSLGADFLYRIDFITAENKDPRNRQQFQIHVRLNAELQDNLTLGFQLRSGDTDPVSAKQAFTGGFSAKPVEIDLAFINWRPIEGLQVNSGKMMNPFYSPRGNKIMWDNEIRPEGVSATYMRPLGAAELVLNSSYFWIQERLSAKEAALFGSQARMRYSFKPAQVLVGAVYFDYQNMKGFPPFYDPTDGVGNSLDLLNNYLYDFNLVELMSELAFSNLFMPFTLYGEYIRNIAPDVDLNTAWIAGMSLGRCVNKGDYAFYYGYRLLEKDSLVGAFNDSCFLGGGTDGKGHELNFEYQVSRKVRTYFTWFISQNGVENGSRYNRMQMDFNYTY